MGFRFRKSVKLAPGVRVNFGKRGSSVSFGGKGARITAGSRGVYGNVGLPGSGLSYTSKRSGGSSRSSQKATSTSYADSLDSKIKAELNVEEDGKVIIFDDYGDPLPQKYVKLGREQNTEVFDNWLQSEADSLNTDIKNVLNVHLSTPAPDSQTVFKRDNFPIEKPVFEKPKQPVLKKHTFFSKHIGFLRAKTDKHNEILHAEYEKELEAANQLFSKGFKTWTDKKATFEEDQNQRESIFSKGRFEDIEIMSNYLIGELGTINWPRETLIDFEINKEGKRIFVDVDLPEIEDMPLKQVAISKNKLGLNIKDRTQTQIRKDYMAHVHAIGFQVTGTVFAALPTTTEVVISGYSQRLNSGTGGISDEYLYSVRINRSVWSNINFENLEHVDPVEAFAQFELERKMTKTGVFKPISPFTQEGNPAIKNPPSPVRKTPTQKQDTVTPKSKPDKSIKSATYGELLALMTNGVNIVQGKQTWEHADEGKHNLDLMKQCCAAELKTMKKVNQAPAPHYFERVAILSRKEKFYQQEVTYCEGYIEVLDHFYKKNKGRSVADIRKGPTYNAIVKRLPKAKELLIKQLNQR